MEKIDDEDDDDGQMMIMIDGKRDRIQDKKECKEWMVVYSIHYLASPSSSSLSSTESPSSSSLSSTESPSSSLLQISL
jgi:hypothetical protein